MDLRVTPQPALSSTACLESTRAGSRHIVDALGVQGVLRGGGGGGGCVGAWVVYPVGVRGGWRVHLWHVQTELERGWRREHGMKTPHLG